MKIDLDPANPKTTIHQEEFKQVIINLLTNAIQASVNGKIEVKTQVRPQNGSVFISIKDFGEGIEDETLQKIFDPFFTTKPTGKGTGLGLSVVYGIVNNSHGDIHVESTPGVGTEFQLTIPCV